MKKILLSLLFILNIALTQNTIFGTITDRANGEALPGANIVLAQTSISGTVVDAENQEAIPGANVIVVGSNFGAVADFNGKFTINT